MRFSFINLIKALLFVAVLGGATYYTIGKIQYRNQLDDSLESDRPKKVE